MDAKLYTYTYPQGCLSLGYSAKKNNEKNVQNPHESDVIPKSGSFMQIHLFDISNCFEQSWHLTTNDTLFAIRGWDILIHPWSY